MMNPTIPEQISYTLRRLHTYGRESIESLLTALRLLEEDTVTSSLRAIRSALDHVTVTNAADADRLLGCMQALDRLAQEEVEPPCT